MYQTFRRRKFSMNSRRYTLWLIRSLSKSISATLTFRMKNLSSSCKEFQGNYIKGWQFLIRTNKTSKLVNANHHFMENKSRSFKFWGQHIPNEVETKVNWFEAHSMCRAVKAILDAKGPLLQKKYCK